jgi:AAHS family 4-hydroxybenzoate transporter-like MFS transporter
MDKIDVGAVIDRSRVGPLQIKLFVLCALCLIMDGFDVQVIGFVAPEISREWGTPSAALGPVFAAGNLGVLIGALVFTMVADAIGRRPVLIWSTVFFAVMMLATARASSIEELIVLRFITGLGLGSVIPSATALIGEFSPLRSRVTLMMTITVGFTAGAAFGGLVAAWLIPRFGWRAVFYFGGGIPLFIAAAMYLWLPESLQLLVLRGKRAAALTLLRRIDPSIPPEGVEPVVAERAERGLPARQLFLAGRAPGTLLLWLVNFMNILLIYTLANWLPIVVRDAGHSTQTAVLVGTTLQVGGTLGTLAFARMIAGLRFIPVLSASFAVACITLALVGPALPAVAVLTTVVFVAGWCTIGAQPGLNALSATFYPTSLRSTGVGWGLGVGRLGAIVGPMIAGALIARQWSGTSLFYAAAVPAALAVVGTLALGRAIRVRSAAAAGSTPGIASGRG